MKKFILWTVVALVVLGSGGYAWYAHAEAVAAASASNATPTAKVERKDVRVSVQSQGGVSSNRDVDIKCKASGNITALPYTDVSAAVAPNALLLQLDTKDEIQALDSANAAVDADTAKLQEALLNWEISKLNLITTTKKVNADLASAKAKAQDAQNKMNRTQALFEQKLASKEDLETAQTTAASAEADVQSAESAVAELEQDKKTIDTKEQQKNEAQAQLKQDTIKQTTALTNLGYCTVNAPDVEKGREKDPPQWRISKLTLGVAPGYLVQSGSNGSSGGTTVMTLSDMSHIFVLATVAESDIGGLLTRFQAGQELPVQILADAYPGVKFKGKVVRIAEMGVSTNNVVTFEVKIEVTSNNRDLLRPIMTADVEIVSAERQNVLTIPVQAFTRKRADATTENGTQSAEGAVAEATATTEPANGAASGSANAGGKHHGGKHKDVEPMPTNDQPIAGTVRVIKPGGATEQRDVMVGISDGANYEVLSGLEEGESIALNKMGADSKWRGGGAGGMMRGIGR